MGAIIILAMNLRDFYFPLLICLEVTPNNSGIVSFIVLFKKRMLQSPFEKDIRQARILFERAGSFFERRIQPYSKLFDL